MNVNKTKEKKKLSNFFDKLSTNELHPQHTRTTNPLTNRFFGLLAFQKATLRGNEYNIKIVTDRACCR